MPCLPNLRRPIFLKDHVIERALPYSVSVDLPGVGDSCNALSYLLHLNLDNLVFKVSALFLNFRLENLRRGRLLVSHDFLFELMHVKTYTFLGMTELIF